MFTLQGHIKGSRNDQFRAWRAELVKAAYAAQKKQARKEIARQCAIVATIVFVAAMVLFA